MEESFSLSNWKEVKRRRLVFDTANFGVISLNNNTKEHSGTTMRWNMKEAAERVFIRELEDFLTRRKVKIVKCDAYNSRGEYINGDYYFSGQEIFLHIETIRKELLK